MSLIHGININNQTRTVSNEQQKTPKEEKFPKRHYGNRGFFLSQYAAQTAAAPAGLISLGIMKAMKKVSNLNAEDTIQLRKATQAGLKQSGLHDKGVRVHLMDEVKMPKTKDLIKNITENAKNMTFESSDDIAGSMSAMFDKFIPIGYNGNDEKALGAIKEEMQVNTAKMAKKMEKFTGKLPEEAKGSVKGIQDGIADMMAKVQGMMFKTGNNACYLPNANKIITPNKTLQTSVFHEMGHALNNNVNILLKGLQKARPAAKILPGIILTAALLNKRKTTDEKSDNKVQNFFDGVKQNAGKLTFLAMTPMIAEETLASIRGGMIAENLAKKGQMSKQLLNKVRLTNACSFASYMTAGLVAAGTAALAVKIKDHIQEKYEAKKNEKYDARDAKIAAKRQAKAEKKSAKTQEAQ